MAGVVKRLKALDEEVTSHSTQTQGMNDLIRRYQDKAVEVEGEIEAVQQSLDHMIREVAPAYGWTAPEHTNRTEEEIDADLARVDKRIKTSQKNRNVHEVTARYHALMKEDRRKEGIQTDLQDVDKYVSKGR